MMNENSSKMAQFISVLRKEKKLTQKELAEQLGVTDKAVSKWERGLNCPDISLLSKLAQVLGVTISELLNGQKAETSAPELDAIVETTIQYAHRATKSEIAKNARWKFLAIVSAGFFFGILILLGCTLVLDRGLAGFILPVNITAFVWLMVLFGVFVAGKNKIGTILLSGLIIFLTTFYYAALNHSQTRDIDTYGVFNGFQNAYLPHYTIIFLLLIVSIVLTASSFLFRNQEPSGDKTFFLAAANITIMILSVLTVPAIMDYVDINGLGVNGRFTILLLLTFLTNFVSLALLAKRFIWQMVEKRKSGIN
jgi:transcriptional regulator with XRE-family HTH domain